MVKSNPFLALIAVGGALVALSLLVLMVVVEAPPAGATFPGTNGNIAYASTLDGDDYEIYTIPKNGGTPLRLTRNSVHDLSPSYSPDGTKIAYVHDDEEDDEIYKISQNGGTPVPLTNTRKYESTPSYSPDGTKIAYTGHDGDNEIYRIAQNGGTPFKVTRNSPAGDRDPSWGSTPP